MRRFTTVTQVGPAQRWPESDPGGAGVPMPAFRWVLIENRGAPGTGNDLLVAIGSRVSHDLATTGYDFRVPAGAYLIRNVASGEWGEAEPGDEIYASELSILNIGQAAVPVLIETDMEEIVQRISPLSPSALEGQAFSDSTAVGAALSAAVPAVQGATSWITGFDATLGIPAAAATVLVTVTGPAQTLSFAITASAGSGGGALERFPAPIPAGAPDTPITVSVPAVGGAAAVNALNVYGYQQ